MHDWYNLQIDNPPERSNPPEDNTHLTGTLYSLTRPLATGLVETERVWNEMKTRLDGPRTVV